MEQPREILKVELMTGLIGTPVLHTLEQEEE
jgi:hypothetical protein